MISPMVQSWINHLLISVGIILAFVLIKPPLPINLWQLGAFAAFSFYLGREVRDVEIEAATGKINWIDHIGDLAGATLLLILVAFS